MKTYTEDEIREYVESHDENQETPHETLVDMFRSIYGSYPTADEIREGLWSHVCCGVSHS